MIAKYHDPCRDCGEPIAVGDEIHWSPEGGPRCLDCGPERPDERRAEVAMPEPTDTDRAQARAIMGTQRAQLAEDAEWLRRLAETYTPSTVTYASKLRAVANRIEATLRVTAPPDVDPRPSTTEPASAGNSVPTCRHCGGLVVGYKEIRASTPRDV